MKIYCFWFAVIWIFSFGVGWAKDDGFLHDLSAGDADPAVVQAGILLEAIAGLHAVHDGKKLVDFRPTTSDGKTLDALINHRVSFGIVKGSSLVVDNEVVSIFTRELRVVALLWREAIHFLVKKEHVQSGTLSDLRALQQSKILLGTTGTPTATLEEQVLKPLRVRGGTGMRKQLGDYEGIIWLSGRPSGLVMSLEELGSEWFLLDAIASQKDRVGNGAWTRSVLPKGSYPGMQTDIRVFTEGVFLLSLATIDNKSVYELVEALFADCFNMTKRSPLSATSLADQTVWTDGDLLEPHEGALSYYRDVQSEANNKDRCQG